MKILVLSLSMAAATAAFGQQAQQQRAPMTFFVTSVGVGNGANLGGLEGADAAGEIVLAEQERKGVHEA